MPTVILQPGATIFVTGVNGLIGSHIVDQLLKLKYNVRGAVRDVEKNKRLKEYFDGKYDDAEFTMVAVPDMTADGCYDDVVSGVEGFIHVASPLSGLDAPTAIATGIRGALNALEASTKELSIKRFVFTSSSIAATFPKPNVEFSINENSYNEEALEMVKKDPNRKGLYNYAAMKTATEQAMWKWMDETKPGFVLNTILPNANFGPVLVPEHQGFRSTIDWVHGACWTGENMHVFEQVIDPQWFISPTDDALLHVSALIHEEVASERLFGFAETWNFNQILAILRRAYPERKFQPDGKDMGVDRMSVPNQRAEEVLRWVKGEGWDGLEKSLIEMTDNWV